MSGIPILVAEDDVISREMLVTTLKQWNYNPIEVGNGRDALAVLESDTCPQLAILDWRMPEINGPEICNAVRSSSMDSYVYLILLTSLYDRDAQLAGLEAGADDFLFKPFDPDELRLRLRTGMRVVDLQDRMKTVQDLLQQRLERDTLTGAASRDAVIGALEREYERAGRIGESFGLLKIDVDHFSDIKDLHGPVAGGQALQHIARVMQGTLRRYDTCGRLRGDKFLVVLPDASTDHTTGIARRIAATIRSSDLVFGESRIDVTLSIGALSSCHPQAGETAEEMMGAVDQALCSAKAAGRNRIWMYGEEDTERELPGPRPCAVPASPEHSLSRRDTPETVAVNVSPEFP